MKIDPAIVRLAAENVRAEVLSVPTVPKLSPSLVSKIADRVPVFRGMSTECLMRTLALGQQYAVKAGEAVFKEGDVGDSFFVIVSGEVVVEKATAGDTTTLTQISVGECFGEMAMVGKNLRSATIRARRDTVTMRFYQESVDAYPDIARMIYRNIARILAARLDESTELLASLMVANSRFTP